MLIISLISLIIIANSSLACFPPPGLPGIGGGTPFSSPTESCKCGCGSDAGCDSKQPAPKLAPPSYVAHKQKPFFSHVRQPQPYAAPQPQPPLSHYAPQPQPYAAPQPQPPLSQYAPQPQPHAAPQPQPALSHYALQPQPYAAPQPPPPPSYASEYKATPYLGSFADGR